jgi:hypothetical protein
MNTSIESTPAPPTPSEATSPSPIFDDLKEELLAIENSMSTPSETTELMQQILVQLASQNINQSSLSKAIKWPEWDGKRDSYSLFKWEVRAKLTNEHGKLGSNHAICTNILMNIPKEKKQRVIFWLQEQERIGGGFLPEDFLQHMDDKFLDREEERKSLDKLDRLRQGKKQKFEDFRQQFEQLAAQAGTMAPNGPTKVAAMRRAINPLLSKYLITARLSYTDYDEYVAEVQSIATNLEAHSEFQGQSGSKKHYYHTETPRPSFSKTVHQQSRDLKGDTPILDVAAIVS